MKFLNEIDQQIFEYEAGNDKDKFIKKRKELIGHLKDFKKSQASKHSWHQNRWKMLTGMKRFHRSTTGKKFHRKLGSFLANRIFGNKSSSQSQRESYDLQIALSSAFTHTLLEKEYYFPEITEEIEFDNFVDFFRNELGKILIHLEEENFNFKKYEEFLLRLCETNALISSFAEKTGKKEKEIEDDWNNIKQGLLDSGKKEDDDGFYAILVSTLKKKLDL